MPSDYFNHPALTDLLADAFADLPEAEAKVLWLYLADGLSFAEIGDRLGMSRKSIRNLWGRGLKSLKGKLDGCNDRPDR
jgi:RNA polymerase sigma-70 factor (ECF subfamily)